MDSIDLKRLSDREKANLKSLAEAASAASRKANPSRAPLEYVKALYAALGQVQEISLKRA